MTLKHILLELQQWFEMKMKEKHSRRLFLLFVCAVIVVLITGTAINGVMMQTQFGDMGPYGSPWGNLESSAQNGGSGNPQDYKGLETSGSPTDNQTREEDFSTGGMGMEPTPLMSGIIMVSILSVAIVTAMALYLHYRKKHIDHIPPLTTMKMWED